jgi:hypothetical protein
MFAISNSNNFILEVFSKWRIDKNFPSPCKDVLNENKSLSADGVAFILSNLVQSYSYEYFKDLVRLVLIYEHELEKNPNAMLHAAFAAWTKGFPSECERWSKNLICMAPRHPAGYLRLGLSCLTSQKFAEAFVALSAGLRNANNDAQLIGWCVLAERMAVGQRQVVFEKLGQQFRFRLSCFSTQAAESDAAHLSGRFTEEAELEFLSKSLSGCRNFVEVGSLVGNHTVFLASFFQPEKYLVVDADSRSIEETTANVELNKSNYPQTDFSFKESALAANGGLEVEISGKTITTRTLQELLPPDLDFLKIDIDGMEGDLLDPLLEFLKDKHVRVFIEVESQYLNDYEKKMREIGYLIFHRTDHGNYANLFFYSA